MSTLSSPAEQSSHYLNEYRGDTLINIAAVFITFESISVALRIYARIITTSKMGWDDMIVPLGWLANIGLCVLGITMVHTAGVGYHAETVWKDHPERRVSWAKSLFALQWLYLAGVVLPKMSILFLYLRVFIDRRTRNICFVLTGLIVANWMAYLLASIFQCWPISYQWDKTIKGGRCFNQEIWYKTSSVPNIATDVIILVLPIPLVWRLKASRVRKLGLLVIFLVGSTGIIASSLRLVYFCLHDAFTDSSMASVLLVGFSIVEAGMYLIAACLLALRPVLAQLSLKELTARLYGAHTGTREHGKSNSSEGLRLDSLPQPDLSAGIIEAQYERGTQPKTDKTAKPLAPQAFDNDEELDLIPLSLFHGIRVKTDILVEASNREETA